MSWLTDTLQGIPLNAVLREKISLVEQKLKDMEQEKKKLEEKVTELDKENSGLKTENANLKQQLSTATNPDAKPQVKQGCYVFDGDETRLYCTGCWDSKEKKHLTSSLTVGVRRCPVCRAVFDGGR